MIPVYVATSMVAMVQTENSNVTETNANVFIVAAGYMIIGISGSQGPNANRINKLQNAFLDFFPFAC